MTSVGALWAMVWLAACPAWDLIVRVPIVDVGTTFLVADATWFEAEQTMFVFYEIHAQEGLSEFSVVELTYRTDDVDQPWTDLLQEEAVHDHVAVFCGPRTLCGSYSLHVETPPRDVGLRIRYHRDGELALNAPLNYSVVADGPVHTNRSAVLYGVWDEENLHVQWRLRHQFPAIRNHAAQRLGLRRRFSVDGIGSGDLIDGRVLFSGNPYGYGALSTCPADFLTHNNATELTTTDRAMFDTTAFVIDSYPHEVACADVTVTDALGTFTATAIAQKNPQTRPAIATVTSPTDDATRLAYQLMVCGDRTSQQHQDMQRQRMLLDDGHPVICIDDYGTAGFADRLAARFTDDADRVRGAGLDMVIVIALNRPENAINASYAVEQALEQVLTEEGDQSSPRVAGAFVFDSSAHFVTLPNSSRQIMWCPSLVPTNQVCDFAPTTRIPINSDLSLAQLPILPGEDQFETFIDEYGVGQTGEMTTMSFRTPQRTPVSTNVPIEEFGVATFFNNEALTPEPDDGFSYCANADTGLVVFSVEGFEGVLPISLLGQIHPALQAERYPLGLAWDFPYLMQVNYDARLAAAVVVPEEVPDELGLVAAFGIATPTEAYLGSGLWQQDAFDMSGALDQCTDFCDHPTFAASGVYNVDDLFPDYANRCYRPTFPEIGDDGFPSDP